jgi:hypothetical protein
VVSFPKIIKREKDLTGNTTLTFQSGDDKPYDRSFSDMRGGLSWPIRDKGGFLVVLGLLNGAKPGAANAIDLIYEAEFKTSDEVAKGAYNKALDLSFSTFYTDLTAREWNGFNFDFKQYLVKLWGGAAMRILHSPLAHDFMIGLDVLKRYGKAKGLVMPEESLALRQLREIQPDDLKKERPELEFNAVNALRYAVVSYDRIKPSDPPKDQREISVKGWA